MESLLSPEASLAGLFISSFLAATLLPGGSEIVFVALLAAHPDQLANALGLATLGNTLGGMSTYGMARLLPAKVGVTEGNPLFGTGDTARAARVLAATRRHGAPALFLAWVPLIGDALCAAAGWLRLPWLPCLLWMAAGKGARYGLLAWGVA